MKKSSGDKATKISNPEATSETGSGRLTFANGDVYDGEYKVKHSEFVLFKEGRGTYITDNYDVYDGVWVGDSFADADIHVRYNNDAQFRGRIDSRGMMNGPGTYIFPDGSSVEATWVDNKPSTNVIYREPRGFAWAVHNVSQDAISFSWGNHFWRDMLSDRSTTQSTVPPKQE